MRLLLDQGVARDVARILCESGHDAVHVCELGMRTAEDLAILDAAKGSRRICITLDHDFHTHLALSRASQPSVVPVVLLRIQGIGAAGQAALILAVLKTCDQALAEGAAVSADAESIRVRRLPLR